MATLLPALSSDEEDNTKALEEKDDVSSGDEVDEEFSFGGILGEDGGNFASEWMGSRNSKGWSYQSALSLLEKNDATMMSTVLPRMDVASLIAAKRRSLKKDTEKQVRKEEEKEEETEPARSENDSGNDNDASEQESSSESESSGDSEDEADTAGAPVETDTLKTRTGQDDQEEDNEDMNGEDREEAAKAAAFFDSQPIAANNDTTVFAQLTLSRPLLRGVAAMGFVRPTPIQSSVIPVALAGRDVCASAVTGSGKTAAFVLPILERLTQRALGSGIKCLILTPTRELAAQCLGMIATLAQYTNIRATLIVGGAKNVKAQAAELRMRPDIVVATPGRLLDHVTNSSGVTLDDVEFLILDECDKLLDLGFQEEVHEIIKACPTERQTLLFSATMTTKVDDLVKLSLKRPVRVKVSEKQNPSSTEVEIAPRLEQEFVRVRSGNEGVNREGMLLALLTRTFTSRTIVFFDTKAAAHRLMIFCGLCGIKCAELHGDLTQVQRLTALEQFRKGDVDVLLATDLAARGLDIDRLETVINFEMPSQVQTYVHRIGRTARAGRGGKSCTLIGEGRRHLMKEVIKDAEEKSMRDSGHGPSISSKSGIIRSRTIPAAVVAHFVAKINSLEPHVDEVLQAEAVARLDRLAEMEAMRAKNIIEHSDDIKSRPQREWFASGRQKQSTKEAVAEKQRMIAEKVGTGMHRMTRKKRRAREAKEDLMEALAEREENGMKAKKLVTDKSIKTAARAHKKKLELAEKEIGRKSVYDEDQERKASEKKREKEKKRKGPFSSDAIGDSSLFDDERVTHTKKAKAEEKRPSSYNFTGYDPSKPTTKGKKKSAHAFKSKSKHKRRK